MKNKRINYFKYFSLFFAIAVLVFIAGCTGASPTASIINSFSAIPSTITVGESSTLSWSVTDATSVTINNGIGPVALTGTTAVNPTTTTTYTLTATNVAGSVTATTTVTVSSAVTGVTLDPATMTLTAGGATGTLVATVAPADATNKSVTWSSSAPAVATVANGVVTPVTVGTATIIVATVDGGLTATCTVSVKLLIVVIPPPLLVIGGSYGGGIVAYILKSGDPGYDPNVYHGLIATTADQSAGTHWYNGSYVVTGATGTAIGTGQANTTAIVTIQGAGSYAAMLCATLTEGGYNDWFLPSKDELDKLYINKVAIGGFTDYTYWSSSETYANRAWCQVFSNGLQAGSFKVNTARVRAVRAF
jgi:hypothetical protein